MRTPRHGLLGGPGPTHPEGRQAVEICLGVKVQSSVLRGAQESLNSGVVFQNQVPLEARGREGGKRGEEEGRGPDE